MPLGEDRRSLVDIAKPFSVSRFSVFTWRVQVHTSNGGTTTLRPEKNIRQSLLTCAQQSAKGYKCIIGEVCADAEPEIRSLLGDLPENIELACQTGPFVIPETGEMGAAIAPNRIGWTVDDRLPEGVATIVRTQLRFTLFHELHHLVRGWIMYGGAAPNSFMDGVVSEGLATVFERDFGGREAPWGEYPEDVEDWVTELLELPVSAPYNQWMFQHPDGRRWIGYRAGTYIADQAILASGYSATDLVHFATDEILMMSGIRLEKPNNAIHATSV